MITRMKLTIVLCAVVIGIIAVLLIKHPPLKVRHPVKLETRAFKVDAHLFSTNAVLPKAISSKLGVDLTAPGRSIAFNDKLGLLFVKATASELDTVERAIQALNEVAPQIHIKARFIEVPKEGFVIPQLSSNATTGRMTGILSDPEFRTVLQALEHRQGVETLAEPECVTTSGRQTQMRVTEPVAVVTNWTIQTTSSNSTSTVPHVEKMEVGPVVDVVPSVLSDGYTINLKVTTQVLTFLGYEEVPADPAPIAPDKLAPIKTTLPHFRIQNTDAIVNLWDGQTVVLGFINLQNFVHAKLPVIGDISAANVLHSQRTNETEILVFITATIVDPAGNRVHSDNEMLAIEKQAQNGIPPQPQISTPSP
jgi:type II secretory pathway component GspD/PulD (secretin)